ncbi:hypothetical protein NDU88_010743, partial [Pleurodeles waltl]
ALHQALFGCFLSFPMLWIGFLFNAVSSFFLNSIVFFFFFLGKFKKIISGS